VGKILKKEGKFWVCENMDGFHLLSMAKKIILTTDQDLINDSVQAIDYEFLEWFVKNPSCEKVEVIYDKDAFPYGVETAKGYGWYKIIIPQEEHKQETLEEAAMNNIPTAEEFINIGLDESGFEFYGDMKKIASKKLIQFAKLHVEAALKAFQAERMYTEEEVLKLLRKSHFVEQNIEEWFEQHKKK
jgi:hypothetical protein